MSSNVATLTPVRRTKLALALSRAAETGSDIGVGTFAKKVPDESNRPVTCQARARRLWSATESSERAGFRNRSIDLGTEELWDVMCLPCPHRSGSGRLGPNTGHLYRKQPDGSFMTLSIETDFRE